MAVSLNSAGAIPGTTKFGAGMMASSQNGGSDVGPSALAGAGGLADFVTRGNPSPMVVLIGLVGLLVLLKVLSEHPGTKLDPAHFHVGTYNILTVTVAAVVGIAFLKLIFNWIHVPGVTPLVNFV